MNEITYDRKCYDLAEVFLADSLPNDSNRRRILAHELAQEIQVAIEDFLKENGLQ